MEKRAREGEMEEETESRKVRVGKTERGGLIGTEQSKRGEKKGNRENAKERV